MIPFNAIEILFIVFVLVCLLLVVRAIGINNKRAAIIFLPSSITWLIATSILSEKEIFSDFSNLPPKIVIVFIIPLIVVIALCFNRRILQFLRNKPAEWLIYIQIFRVFVELFLWWLYKNNIIPVQMTFEGRNLDFLTGITAPIVAFYFVHKRLNKTIVIIWNILGLCLLINIVAITFLSLPTPLRIFQQEPSSIAITTFPIILLPAFLVPLAYSMHLFSIIQMKNLR